MGADDDAGCVEHEWGLTHLHLSLAVSGAAQRCTRCGAAAYDDLTPSPRRPKL